jgi:hypothetical protein
VLKDGPLHVSARSRRTAVAGMLQEAGHHHRVQGPPRRLLLKSRTRSRSNSSLHERGSVAPLQCGHRCTRPRLQAALLRARPVALYRRARSNWFLRRWTSRAERDATALRQPGGRVVCPVPRGKRASTASEGKAVARRRRGTPYRHGH